MLVSHSLDSVNLSKLVTYKDGLTARRPRTRRGLDHPAGALPLTWGVVPAGVTPRQTAVRAKRAARAGMPGNVL